MNGDFVSNPFVGLRPFESDESLLFFGRQDQTLELLQRLHLNHFVAVVGSSGCGKSSLIRAGLIPALKAGFLVDDRDRWLITVMKPGQSPLYNMVEAILNQLYTEKSPPSVKSICDQIKEEGIDALLRIIQTLWNEQNTNFFLLVDQFEELFRFSIEQGDMDQRDEAIDFVNALLELSGMKELPVYIVITMRSDFIGDCDLFFGLPEAMNQSQYLVPRLNRVQLKSVIEGPVKLFGGSINSSLTSCLLNDLGKIKDELPVLQHALMRIWDNENKVDKNGELDLNDYYAIGGLEKALSNHADEAIQGLSEQELILTKKMFQSLTAVDENGRKIRRPAVISELEAITGAGSEQLMQIINRFIEVQRSFLVITSIGDKNEKIIDISHESLIRQWDTLNAWVNEEAESARMYNRLCESALLNQNQKAGLLSDEDFRYVIKWWNSENPTREWAEKYNKHFELANHYMIASRINVLANEKLKKTSRIVLIVISIISVSLLIVTSVLAYRLKDNNNILLSREKSLINSKKQVLRALQLALSDRGKKFDASPEMIIDILEREQKRQIDSLIIPRASKSKIPGITDLQGHQIYDYLVWIEVPSFRRDEIKEVIYRWACEGFLGYERIGIEPSLGFAYSYRGSSSCSVIHIMIKLKSGREIDKIFRMADYLAGTIPN